MLKTGTSIILVLAFLLCQSKVFTANVFADKDSILLTLENASFVPLSNVHGNQVSMSVRYQVNDESLEGEKVNGIMKLLLYKWEFNTFIFISRWVHGQKKGGTKTSKLPSGSLQFKV